MQDKILDFGATDLASPDESENSIDLGAVTSQGGGTTNIVVWAVITTVETGATSLRIEVEDSANDSSFASTTVGSAAILQADLTLGARFEFSFPSNSVRRYIRLKYIPVGTANGNLKAGINIGGLGQHVAGVA